MGKKPDQDGELEAGDAAAADIIDTAPSNGRFTILGAAV